MNIRKNDGFVLIQALVFVMVVLLFLTSLFSASVFRAKIARMRIQKEEAKHAAEVALQLIEIEIENGNSEWIESGLPKIKTTLEFESDDGEIIISIPVVIWRRRYQVDCSNGILSRMETNACGSVYKFFDRRRSGSLYLTNKQIKKR